MDLIDKLKSISERIAKTKTQVETEEATKNAFVMPFIATLGFDVFNPTEVVPEFTADIGIKKGEKVDYCILKEGQPIIIIECKHWKENLMRHNSQLHRYFHVTNARFAILTNGISFQFFTDLEAKNKMDDRPFLEFNLEKVSEQIALELKRFQKENFDEEAIINVASELKNSKQIKEILSNELKTPSEEFIKYFASRVYQGRVTQKILEQFGFLVQKSVKSLLTDMINERLQLAIEKEEMEEPIFEEEVEIVISEIETTDEELQGFRIVQAILVQQVESERIAFRDAKSYFSILLDNNNRKPICRLWFNRNQRYLGIFDEHKKENRIPIEKVADIYQYSNQLLETIGRYES